MNSYRRSIEIFPAFIVRLLNSLQEYVVHSTENSFRWRKNRRRILIIGVIISGVLFLQTLMIYSPRFLISALYHGRGIGVHTMQDTNPQRSEKLLTRMYALYILYHGDRPVKNHAGDMHIP